MHGLERELTTNKFLMAFFKAIDVVVFQTKYANALYFVKPRMVEVFLSKDKTDVEI